MVESDLVMKMTLLQSRMQKHIAAGLSAHGISFTEYMVMRHLSQATGSSMRRIDLAEKIGLSASGVTRVLNPMEKIGLVVKESNARDARVSLVALSEAGQRVLEEAEISFNHVAQNLFKGIQRRNLKLLTGIVDSLN